MEEYRTVGKPIPNLDGIEKVKGNAVYALDIKLNGMLFGKILRSQLPHAKIVNIDVSKAERLKGVKAIITAKDTAQIKYSIIPSLADKLPLENEKVRYIGDEVAAVAAVDEDTALEALDLIELDYEELPALFDPVEAMQTNAPPIHDAFPNNIVRHIQMECGDVAEGFNKSALVLEETFATQAQSHCPLEVTSCVANYDHNGKITIWVSNQAPHVLRQRLSHTLDIDPSKIHVVTPYIGGGFGSKIDLESMHVVSVVLSKKAGRPVKIINTRKEQFEATRIRHPTFSKLKFGVSGDGIILAKQANVVVDNGAYNSHGPAVLAYNNVMFSTLYRVENIKYDGYLVYTNKNFGGAMRGYGDPQATFAQESMMDMIAEELKMDPIDLRLRNANNPNELTSNDVMITSCGLRDTLIRAREISGWTEKRKKRAKNRGIGIASMIYTGGGSIGSGFNYSGATMQVNADGSIHLKVGATDIGQGSNTILTQIAAEVFGVDHEAIRLTTSDTDTTLPCMGTFGSRVTLCAGNAVVQAAKEVKRKVLEEAAEILEANINDLQIEDKNVFVKGSPKTLVPLSEVAAKSYYKKKKPLIGQGYYNGPEKVSPQFDPVSYRGYPSPAMVFATHIAEIEIDPGTGRLDVVNFTAAHDLGKAVNPLLAEGQIEGGVIQGIGWALTEDLKFENGRIINPNFRDYKILTIKDAPEVSALLIESDDPNGPFGAKGIGECAMVPTAPAVVNAIYDAIGVRIKDLPATSEKIFYAIKDNIT